MENAIKSIVLVICTFFVVVFGFRTTTDIMSGTYKVTSFDLFVLVALLGNALT